jgi:acyl-CoA thioester hydrolase
MLPETMPAPVEVTGQRVLPEWIDYNGHMNVAYYVLAFDRALDKVFDGLGIGADYVRRSGHSFFMLEAHVTYIREVVADDPLRFAFQLLDADEKRLHYVISMFHATDGFLAARSEQIAMHIDMAGRRGAPMPKAAQQRLKSVLTAHAHLPRPPEVGHVIGIRRRAGA